MGLEQTSKRYDIPKKNIIRWIKKSLDNDFIRGRKPINPLMETQLTNWIRRNIAQKTYITQNDIRIKARQLSNDSNFKASKGWL